MSTTQPIRRNQDIQRLKNYFLEQEKYRDYLLVTMGLNTALRISDILNLKWTDVYNFEKRKIVRYIRVTEQKTQKENQIYINKAVVLALKCYMQYTAVKPEKYIFTGRKSKEKPISRVQAYRIIREAAEELGIEGHISCHSLRKTFGYYAWKSGAEPALIMDIYNHSSFRITKRYLGIIQDDKDKLFLKMNL